MPRQQPWRLGGQEGGLGRATRGAQGVRGDPAQQRQGGRELKRGVGRAGGGRATAGAHSVGGPAVRTFRLTMRWLSVRAHPDKVGVEQKALAAEATKLPNNLEEERGTYCKASGMDLATSMA